MRNIFVILIWVVFIAIGMPTHAQEANKEWIFTLYAAEGDIEVRIMAVVNIVGTDGAYNLFDMNRPVIVYAGLFRPLQICI